MAIIRKLCLDLLYRTVYLCVDMLATSSHLMHKAFRLCEYFGHKVCMAASAIHTIFNAVVVAKLTYAASSWWGFTTAKDRQRLEAVIRCGIRSGLCVPDHLPLEDLVSDAHDKLFNLILYSKHYVLHSIHIMISAETVWNTIRTI